MVSSGKQAIVGRRERTSLKAPAGEATHMGAQAKSHGIKVFNSNQFEFMGQVWGTDFEFWS